MFLPLALVGALLGPGPSPLDELDALKRTLRSADEVDSASAALDSIAALIQQDPAQSASATEVLAEALDHDSAVVQGHALQLLREFGLPEIAAPLVVKSCKVWVRELDKISELELPIPDLNEKNPRKRKAAYEKFKRESERLDREIARLTPIVALQPHYTEAFMAWQHDAAVEGLVLLLPHVGIGEVADRIIDRLFDHGTRDALLGLVTVVERYDAALEARDDRPAPPSDVMRAKRAEGDQKYDAWIATFCDKLRTFAAERSLDSPQYQPWDGRGWKRWAKKARKQLPDSVDVDAESAR